MANTNNNSLQIEDETQDPTELLAEETWGEGSNPTSSKKTQNLNDQKRREVRRNIEEIKERRRLKELLGDDYDEFDYLDS